MRFLFLEPFYGGSHRVFCDGLIENSTHEIDLFKLPSENFRWRIRGAAYYFFKKIRDINQYDGVIISDMISLCEFQSFYRGKLPPVLFYFHENQIDYPLADNQKIDYHLVFSNINSALCADLLYFNSFTHREKFIGSCDKILERMPKDHSNMWITREIEKKAGVLYPGCDFSGFGSHEKKNKNRIIHILWNHRWDHDKQPEIFFRLLKHLKERDLEFRVIILGEKGPKKNLVFMEGKKDFPEEIIHFGYASTRSEYIELIKRCDIAISTSSQENFGYSVIESIKAGCIPLLPDRLSYPEIIPEKFHDRVLYRNYRDLLEKMTNYIKNPDLMNLIDLNELVSHVNSFSWENLIKDYDDTLEKLSNLA